MENHLQRECCYSLCNSPSLVGPVKVSNYFNSSSETEFEEHDIKLEIKSETISEHGSCEEIFKDSNTVPAITHSTGKICQLNLESASSLLSPTYLRNGAMNNALRGAELSDNPVRKLINQLPVSEIRKVSNSCPFSISLQCPICPKLVKGGLISLPRLENHILTQHYQHRKHLLGVVRKYKLMTKQCSCLSHGNKHEKLLKHLNMIK